MYTGREITDVYRKNGVGSIQEEQSRMYTGRAVPDLYGEN